MSFVQNPIRVEKRRDEIITAACECFKRKGFIQTTMVDIAHAAKISVGSLYNYYENKDALVEVLAQRELESLSQRLQTCFNTEMPPEQLHEAVKQSVLECMDSVRVRVALEVFVESVHNPRIARCIQNYDKEIREILFQSKKHLFSGDEKSVRAKIEMHLCLFDGLNIRILSNPNLDREALAEVIATTILKTS